MKDKVLKSDQETNQLAVELANKLLRKKKQSQATVLGLAGDLGTGKTTFTQSFARTLGVRRRILSPTFLIMKRFSLPGNLNFKDLYHIDAYRVRQGDLKQLGFDKILQEPNIILIEWADRVKNILPKDTIWLRFKHGQQENERKVTIN